MVDYANASTLPCDRLQSINEFGRFLYDQGEWTLAIAELEASVTQLESSTERLTDHNCYFFEWIESKTCLLSAYLHINTQASLVKAEQLIWEVVPQLTDSMRLRSSPRVTSTELVKFKQIASLVAFELPAEKNDTAKRLLRALSQDQLRPNNNMTPDAVLTDAHIVYKLGRTIVDEAKDAFPWKLGAEFALQSRQQLNGLDRGLWSAEHWDTYVNSTLMLAQCLSADKKNIEALDLVKSCLGEIDRMPKPQTEILNVLYLEYELAILNYETGDIVKSMELLNSTLSKFKPEESDAMLWDLLVLMTDFKLHLDCIGSKPVTAEFAEMTKLLAEAKLTLGEGVTFNMRLINLRIELHEALAASKRTPIDIAKIVKIKNKSVEDVVPTSVLEQRLLCLFRMECCFYQVRHQPSELVSIELREHMEWLSTFSPWDRDAYCYRMIARALLLHEELPKEIPGPFAGSFSFWYLMYDFADTLDTPLLLSIGRRADAELQALRLAH